MVKWRDVWSLELDDIFKSCNIELEQRLKLLPKIMNSQMMDEVDVKQEVIDEWKDSHKKPKPANRGADNNGPLTL